jgi:hypothetical protein
MKPVIVLLIVLGLAIGAGAVALGNYLDRRAAERRRLFYARNRHWIDPVVQAGMAAAGAALIRREMIEQAERERAAAAEPTKVVEVRDREAD